MVCNVIFPILDIRYVHNKEVNSKPNPLTSLVKNKYIENFGKFETLKYSNTLPCNEGVFYNSGNFLRFRSPLLEKKEKLLDNDLNVAFRRFFTNGSLYNRCEVCFKDECCIKSESDLKKILSTILGLRVTDKVYEHNTGKVLQLKDSGIYIARNYYNSTTKCTKDERPVNSYKDSIIPIPCFCMMLLSSKELKNIKIDKLAFNNNCERYTVKVDRNSFYIYYYNFNDNIVFISDEHKINDIYTRNFYSLLIRIYSELGILNQLAYDWIALQNSPVDKDQMTQINKILKKSLNSLLIKSKGEIQQGPLLYSIIKETKKSGLFNYAKIKELYSCINDEYVANDFNLVFNADFDSIYEELKRVYDNKLLDKALREDIKRLKEITQNRNYIELKKKMKELSVECEKFLKTKKGELMKDVIIQLISLL